MPHKLNAEFRPPDGQTWTTWWAQRRIEYLGAIIMARPRGTHPNVLRRLRGIPR